MNISKIIKNISTISGIIIAVLLSGTDVHASAECLQRDANGVATETIMSGAAYKELASKAISCDKCSDEKISVVTNILSATIKSQITRKCSAAEQKAFDCKTTKQPGRIFFTDIKTGADFSVSKCNSKLYDAISREVDEYNSLKAQDKVGIYLQELASKEAAPTNAGTVELSRVLNGQLNLPNTDTAQKAEAAMGKAGVPAPVAEKALLMIASGDTQGGADVLRNAGINPAVIQNISELTPTGSNAPDLSSQSGGLTQAQPIYASQSSPFTGPFSGITGNSTGSSGSNPLASMMSAFGSFLASPRAATAAPLPQYPGSLNTLAPLTQPPLIQLQPTPQTPQVNTPTPTTPITQPVAVLLAQPPTVNRGDTLTLSWSTVGMKNDTPCIVTNDAAVISRQNEGYKIIPTTISTPRGLLTFSLACTSVAGGSLQKTTSVTIN